MENKIRYTYFVEKNFPQTNTWKFPKKQTLWKLKKIWSSKLAPTIALFSLTLILEYKKTD